MTQNKKLVRASFRRNRKHMQLAKNCRGHHRYYTLLGLARSDELRGLSLSQTYITPEQQAGQLSCRNLAVAWGMAKVVDGVLVWKERGL